MASAVVDLDTLGADDVHHLPAPLLLVRAEELLTARARLDAEIARIALTHGDLPDHGGEHPQIIATLPYDELCRDLDKHEIGHATLNGHQISPGVARRLACDAEIIPASSADTARSSTSAARPPPGQEPNAERYACKTRAASSPDATPTSTAARSTTSTSPAQHHGPTDTTNGAHVCHYHHWLVHHHNWTISRRSAGNIEVHRT